MTDLIRQHLLRAKQHMKKMADQHRSARTFTVGDWVFLKMQPYVWSSLASRSSHKLSFKYFGPFQVLERVGTVAYKLLLPPSSSVHPVFHVSQLKKALGKDQSASASLPNDRVKWSVPEKILQRRLSTHGLRSSTQVLIKWSMLPVSLATWEDLQDLQQQFP